MPDCPNTKHSTPKQNPDHKDRRIGRVFAYGEDTHTLRLKSKLFDLRVGYVNRHSLCCALRNRFKSKVYTTKRKNKGHHTGVLYLLEVQAGFEPADNGVADRGLTTWLLHQTCNCPNIITKVSSFVKGFFCFYFAFYKDFSNKSAFCLTFTT